MYKESKNDFLSMKIKTKKNTEINPSNKGSNDKIFLPKIDFSTFIFSLNSSALVQLGVLSDPITGNKSIDFVMAQHTIDTIAMLKIKTEGNLNDEEHNMISSIIYDLKMLYVNRHDS